MSKGWAFAGFVIGFVILFFGMAVNDAYNAQCGTVWGGIGQAISPDARYACSSGTTFGTLLVWGGIAIIVLSGISFLIALAKTKEKKEKAEVTKEKKAGNFCHNCGAKLGKESKFCHGCGQSLN